MVKEMENLDKNEAWHVVGLQTRRNPIGIKYLFKKKLNTKRKVEKYKSWLAEKCYS
jgi:hypothetical protein